jgi:hypothetical protein
MNNDRRATVRIAPQGVVATVDGVSVKVLDLSANGALFEHEDRFTIAGARLEIVWKGHRAVIPFRIVRTAIMGRRETRMVYQTGVQFMNADPMSDGVISAIVRETSAPPVPAAPPSFNADDTWTRRVRTPPMEGEGDDTWTRRVKTRTVGEDDGAPYACYRLMHAGWTRQLVHATTQPANGFTIARDATDFAALQRTFENADAQTRRKLQDAIASRLR